MSGSLTIDYLKDWEEQGAMWRAVEVRERHAVVDLCTCYGEPVDRLESDEAEVVEFVRTHRQSTWA